MYRVIRYTTLRRIKMHVDLSNETIDPGEDALWVQDDFGNLLKLDYHGVLSVFYSGESTHFKLGKLKDLAQRYIYPYASSSSDRKTISDFIDKYTNCGGNYEDRD